MNVTNIEASFADIHEFWAPKVISRVNDQYIKAAKVKGEFTWHKHDNEDELFLVVRGNLVIQYEDNNVALGAGDFHVVPRGRMHNPIAQDECWILLIESVGTAHTGDVITDRTQTIEQQLSKYTT